MRRVDSSRYQIVKVGCDFKTTGVVNMKKHVKSGSGRHGTRAGDSRATPARRKFVVDYVNELLRCGRSDVVELGDEDDDPIANLTPSQHARWCNGGALSFTLVEIFIRRPADVR